MRIAGLIITLASGIAVLIGVFLPWISAPIWGFVVSVSGWDMIKLGVAEATDLLLVLIGGILMIAWALPAFILSLVTKRGRKAVWALSIVASIGAALAIAGALWFFIPAMSDGVTELISYGFYVSIAAAMLGLVFGIVTSVTAKGG